MAIPDVMPANYLVPRIALPFGSRHPSPTATSR
jgi:hypothetical protein